MSEYEYELKHSFSYATDKGDMAEANFVTLSAPTFKQLDKVTPIKQAFTSAIEEVTKTIDTSGSASAEPVETDEQITGQQALQLLYRWSGDATKVLLHAEQLFKSGAALVDGETKLTTPMMDKMQLVDFEGLLGAYIANFIAPSLMDGQ